jgi:TPR repeat protein
LSHPVNIRWKSTGLGVVRNAHEAVRLYTIAAKQHFPVAQTLLGEAYAEGRLILADRDGGESLLAHAANTGFGRAKLDLVYFRMRRGQGADVENGRAATNLLMNQFRRAVANTPP